MGGLLQCSWLTPTTAFSSPTTTDHLIDNLFAHSVASEKSTIESLADDIGQVSVSAMTSQDTASSQDSVLRTLIANATLPAGREAQRSLTGAIPLPPRNVGFAVITRYIHEVLPELPFLEERIITSHFEKAYDGLSTYSTSIIAAILATTAVQISSTSLAQAVGLYSTAIQNMHSAFAHQSVLDPLLILEEIIALAQFASIAGERYSDPWALSGIAVRMVVDLGLHKNSKTDRQKRIFWSAFTLDRKIAVPRNLPVGIPDAVINTEVGPSPRYTQENSYLTEALIVPLDKSSIHSLQDHVGGLLLPSSI